MKSKPLILAAVVIATLASGCKQSNPAEENPATRDTNSSAVTQQLQNAGQTVTNVWRNVKDAATNAWENTKEATTNAWVDLKDSLQATKDYTYDQKDSYVASASVDLDMLDRKIKDLSDKVATASDSVKGGAQTKLQELRGKRADLGQKFDSVKNSTEADWNDSKTAFQNSYDDVKNSLKQAWQWLDDSLSS
jgi:hypothetical protein